MKLTQSWIIGGFCGVLASFTIAIYLSTVEVPCSGPICEPLTFTSLLVDPVLIKFAYLPLIAFGVIAGWLYGIIRERRLAQ